MLIRLNQIMPGCAHHLKRAVAKHTFKALENSACRQVIQMLMERAATGSGKRPPAARPPGDAGDRQRTGSTVQHRGSSHYAIPHRGKTIPNPWISPITRNGRHRGEHVAERSCAASPGAGSPPQGAEVRGS